MTALLSLTQTWRPVRAVLAVALATELLAVLALLSRPWLTGWLIDRALHGAAPAALAWPALGLAATWLLRSALSEVRERLLARTCEEALAGLRGSVLGQLLGARGQAPDRLAEAELFAGQAPRLVIEAWSVVLRIGIGGSMLALIHPDLLIAVLPSAMLCVGLAWYGRRLSVAAAGRAAEARAAERARWREIIAAQSGWTPPGWLAWMSDEVVGLAQRRAGREVQAAAAAGWWQPAMAGAVALGVVLVLIAGSGQVARGELSPGSLAAGIFMVFLAVGPLLELAAGSDRWAGVAAAWTRLAAIPALTGPPEAPASGIAWSGLRIAWPAGGTLTLPPAQVAAGGCLLVTGRSGAGKSTLLRCLAGQLAPVEGRVTAARSMLIPHDAALPPWPVEDMLQAVALAAGRPLAPAGLRDAAAQLGLDGLLAGLYGTRADSLHGTAPGQAVALVAAHVSGARLLLLDETLSVLEPALAARAVRALADGGRTVVMAAHRRHGLEDWPVLAIGEPLHPAG